MHRPGHAHALIDTPLSTLDVAPTIMHAAGLKIGPRMQGHSLLNVLDRKEEPQNWAMSRVRRNADSPEQRCWQSALRMEQMKLVVTHASAYTNYPTSYQLFDLNTDPQELNDTANLTEHADILENMIDKMIDARCALEDRTEPRIAEF